MRSIVVAFPFSETRKGLKLSAHAFIFEVLINPAKSGELYRLINEMTSRSSPVLFEIWPRTDEVGRVIVINAQPETILIDYFQFDWDTDDVTQLDNLDGPHLSLARHAERVSARN